MLNEVLVSVLYSYSLRKTVQRAFSLPTEGEFERELLLELAMLDGVMSQSLNVYEERMDVEHKNSGTQNKNKGRVSHVICFPHVLAVFFFCVSLYHSEATASSTSKRTRDLHGIQRHFGEYYWISSKRPSNRHSETYACYSTLQTRKPALCSHQRLSTVHLDCYTRAGETIDRLTLGWNSRDIPAELFLKRRSQQG